MKKQIKNRLAEVLWRQVSALRCNNNFVVIGVVGSVGKTSTKLTIAKFLGEEKRVRFQDGNYNDILSVPLIFFGLDMPKLTSLSAWIKTVREMKKQLKKDYPYDVVVLELGTDGPGQIKQFGKYIELDLAVVTAIAPEHMEFFHNLDSVADEELDVSEYSKDLLLNADMIESDYLERLKRGYLTYSNYKKADFVVSKSEWNKKTMAFDCEFMAAKSKYSGRVHVMGKHQLQAVNAAVAVSERLGITSHSIEKAIDSSSSFPGRMNILRGQNDITIIDDTYNSSPEAVKAALDTVYSVEFEHKIAVLGNMNELGDTSERLHNEIGSYCDPEELDMVITIGPDSNNYLKAAADKRGCKTVAFDDPKELGKYLQSNAPKGSLILLKGSQNKVFLEEAVKQLLEDESDISKLVRQSSSWLRQKEASFNRV